MWGVVHPARDPPMKSWILLPLLTLGAGAYAAEELYRWVDEKGNVTYSDLPPPPSIDDVQQRRFGSRAGTQQLPYALQTATRDFPVTLYTTDCGAGCDDAAKLLDKRGIPYSQKNAKDPQVAQDLMKLMDGKVFAPVLMVGKNLVKGFEEGAWHSALDVAGYPRSNMLPSNAQPKSVAAAPAPAKGDKDAKPSSSAKPSSTKPAPGASQ